MRLFFAVEVPPDVKARIVDVQNQLRATIPEGYLRYVKPDLLHVTLAFLGEVPADRLPEVNQIATKLASQSPTTKIAFQGIGCFPAWRSPQVLWVGVDEDITTGDIATNSELRAPSSGFKKGPLTDLGNQLSNQCADLGDAKLETSTVLHVTLARSNTKLTKDKARTVAEPVNAQSWTDLGEAKVTEILLFESTLGQGPTQHTAIERFPLKP